jgi:hypothetical protein
MRNELAKIRGLATEIVLMADDFGAEVAIEEVAEMAEEIMETSSRLIQRVAEAERAEVLAEHVRCV